MIYTMSNEYGSKAYDLNNTEDIKNIFKNIFKNKEYKLSVIGTAFAVSFAFNIDVHYSEIEKEFKKIFGDNSYLTLIPKIAWNWSVDYDDENISNLFRMKDDELVFLAYDLSGETMPFVLTYRRK